MSLHHTVMRPLSVIAVVSVAALLGACASAAPVDPTAAPVAGGELVIAQDSGATTMDPVAAVSPADIAPMYALYDTLYTLGEDGVTITPDAAAALPEASADATQFTIALRDDVVFSDGTPVTAEDVAFSLNRARTADGAFSYLLGAVSSVSATDDHTVVITTSEPSATLPAVLTSWLTAILPADLEGLSDEEFFAAPIGSGPFTLDSWETGQSMRVVKNDAYWQTGLPYVDAVQWNTVPDANTRVSQVQGGQADVASDVPFSQVEALQSSATVTAETFPANYTTMLIFNEAYAPFADEHVRSAIAQAIDRDTLTASVLFGAGTPACSMLPPSMPFASEPDCPSYDVSAAKAELAESAYPDGFAVELTIDNDPSSSTTAQIVQAQLAEIGIDVEITVVDPGQLYTVFGDEAYQMGLAAWASDIPDPDAQLSYMLDPAAGGNSYYTGYDNPEVTELIAQGRSTIDLEQRAQIYAQVQQIVADEVPQLPLSHHQNAYAFSRDVQNFSVNSMGMVDLLNVSLAE